MEQIEFFEFAIRTLERLNMTYMVVGSCASMSYGEVRMTMDIDIVIDLRAEQIRPLCEAFDSPEFYVSEDGARDALRHRSMFNVLHMETGSKVDFIIPKDDAWSREQLARRQRFRLLDHVEGYAARPEDVIIGKMIYYEEGGSDKHLRDITGMMSVSGQQIDRAYIAKWADSLNLSDIWTAILARIER